MIFRSNKIAKKRCKCGCGQVITGHPNKKFFNKRHKDTYWNRVNPRGHGTHIRDENVSIESVGHKIDSIEDGMHPLDSYSLGQE